MSNLPEDVYDDGRGIPLDDVIDRLDETAPRCGPWDERADGAIVCRKCGEVDWPNSYGKGPFGI